MLIAFIGPAGSGKTTASRVLQDRGFEKLSFATPLKRMLLNGLGVPFVCLQGDLKEQPCKQLGGVSPRHAMQTLGTEWGRECMGSHFWANMWAREYDRLQEYEPTNVVVDDARFPEEFQLIKGLGGQLVQIERPGHVPVLQHSSEDGWKEAASDWLIVNSGTEDNLRESVNLALTEIEHNE